MPSTIALDRGMKSFFDLLGEEYADSSVEEVPEEILNRAYDTVGGDEGTQALADVLKDMIDRDFI